MLFRSEKEVQRIQFSLRFTRKNILFRQKILDYHACELQNRCYFILDNDILKVGKMPSFELTHQFKLNIVGDSVQHVKIHTFQEFTIINSHRRILIFDSVQLKITREINLSSDLELRFSRAQLTVLTIAFCDEAYFLFCCSKASVAIVNADLGSIEIILRIIEWLAHWNRRMPNYHSSS